MARNLVQKGRGVELSRAVAEANAKATMLQNLLDNANRKHKEMEDKYFEMLDQNMILKSGRRSAPEAPNGEGSKPLLPFLQALTHNCNSTDDLEDSLQTEKNVAELRSELALIKNAIREGLRQSGSERMPTTSPPTGSDADNREAPMPGNANLDVVDILSKFNYKEVEKLRKENAEMRRSVPEGSLPNSDLQALLEQIEGETDGRTSKHAGISVDEFSGDLRKVIMDAQARTAKRKQVQKSILSNVFQRVESAFVPKSAVAAPATAKNKWSWPLRQTLTLRNSTSNSKTPK